MINTNNVSEVCREAHGLLRKEKGNNARAFRRFLHRVTTDNIVHQVLTYGDVYTCAQLAAFEAHAQKLDAEADTHIVQPNDWLEVIGTVRNDAYFLVQNSYRFNIPIKTASLNQLRNMTQFVALLAELLEPVIYSTNTTALWLHPDYVFRQLPQTDEYPYQVTAFDSHRSTEVVERCLDFNDALKRIKLMSAHPRFSNISSRLAA